MKKNGYFTVEAVFIVTICIWVFAALVFQGLYVHDTVVMESETNERTAEWLSGGKEKKETEWQTDMTKRLNNKLFLMKVTRVKTEEKINKVIVKAYYELPVSLPYLKKILSGGKALSAFETERERLWAAKYRWDYEALQERKGE